MGHYPSIILADTKSGKLCRLGDCVVTDHRKRRWAVRYREVRTLCPITRRSAKEAWIGSYSGSHISLQDNKWMLYSTFRNQVIPRVAPDQYLHQELFSAPWGNTAKLFCTISLLVPLQPRHPTPAPLRFGQTQELYWYSTPCYIIQAVKTVVWALLAKSLFSIYRIYQSICLWHCDIAAFVLSWEYHKKCWMRAVETDQSHFCVVIGQQLGEKHTWEKLGCVWTQTMFS